MRDIIWSIDTAADTVGSLTDRLRPDVRQHVYLMGKEAITNPYEERHGAAGGWQVALLVPAPLAGRSHFAKHALCWL